ncbi:hypothetical protein QLL95_gp0250 [Cotonvirus japonicus]|uniref:Uncharacterized protein n=1 Tax=Cotonvirus japonicus TaxID=2811091 RepID=A0ABM7NRF5_9VIRU|nr:hypothetical protein QLL95_gp0250 [Cotonvirus japonicus]BCS82739.1 hypothetical protein [Cotonvirus japonicus]
MERNMERNKEKDEQVLCPICLSGYRYFYTLSTNNVVLFCDECECVWLYPERIDYNEAVSDELLVSIFKVTNCKSLFNDNNAGWSTERDIENTCWNILARDNELLTFTKTYNLPALFSPNKANEEIRYPFSYLFQKSLGE